MFLVEKGTKGFKLGQKINDKLGMRASMTAELVFDECQVGVGRWVGRENRSREFHHTIHSLKDYCSLTHPPTHLFKP